MSKKDHEWRESPTETLRVAAGFSIADFDCGSTPGFTGKKHHAEEAHDEAREGAFRPARATLRRRPLDGSRSVLLVIQGMDTAGKGGIVRHVVGIVDPQGVQHHSFGVPTEEEKAHHYLWRIDNALPTPGHIGVFDRSHYEDVLVVRVHNFVEPAVWGERYDEINALEAKVVASGTRIVKCALMVSKEEQLNRLEERLDRPDKYWKYNPHDLDERGLLGRLHGRLSGGLRPLLDGRSPRGMPFPPTTSGSRGSR